MPRLKSWESPRRQGRNDKGKGGSKKKKQWLKRQQMLRNKLKNQQNNQENYQGAGRIAPFDVCAASPQLICRYPETTKAGRCRPLW